MDKLKGSRCTEIALGAAICVFCVLGTAAVALIDPSGRFGALFPGCLFYRLTGLQCAGCGLTRAAHALLRGDLCAAWRFNPMIYPAVPLGAYCLAAYIIRLFTGRDVLPQPKVSPGAFACVCAGIVLFTVLRNIWR